MVTRPGRYATLVATIIAAASTPAGLADVDEQALREAVPTAVRLLLEMQEGDEAAEWPYEGVYRVRGRIPIGYRVGGTSICTIALIEAPGLGDDDTRREAIRRAAAFVCTAIDHPLMAHAVEATYDVRGWGYAYGLLMLLRLQAEELVPEGLEEKVAEATRFYLDGIAATEIPGRGGWNYARRAGFDKPGPPSPFMTAPTLQALFRAREQGHEVDAAMVRRGLDALAGARTATGSFLYAGDRGDQRDEPVPGAVGRMLVGETTLYLAGRSDLTRVRGALDAFLAHWSWLEQRRAKNGTHVPPYGVAPYYFFYAHYYAAQAVELLPARARREYRDRLLERIFEVRDPDGGWNDRVFPRTANYSTAMVLLALLAPDAPAPPRWLPASGEAEEGAP